MRNLSVTELINSIESMKTMMQSCYTYGCIDKDSWHFSRYIAKYEEELGSEIFEQIYSQMASELSQYEIKHNVYTDHEGCTYNELVKK